MCMRRVPRGLERVSDPLELELPVWTAWEHAGNQTWAQLSRPHIQLFRWMLGTSPDSGPWRVWKALTMQASPYPPVPIRSHAWSPGSSSVLIFFLYFGGQGAVTLGNSGLPWFLYSCCYRAVSIWRPTVNFCKSLESRYSQNTTEGLTDLHRVYPYKHIHISHVWKEVKWLIHWSQVSVLRDGLNCGGLCC